MRTPQPSGDGEVTVVSGHGTVRSRRPAPGPTAASRRGIALSSAPDRQSCIIAMRGVLADDHLLRGGPPAANRRARLRIALQSAVSLRASSPASVAEIPVAGSVRSPRRGRAVGAAGLPRVHSSFSPLRGRPRSRGPRSGRERLQVVGGLGHRVRARCGPPGRRETPGRFKEAGRGAVVKRGEARFRRRVSRLPLARRRGARQGFFASASMRPAHAPVRLRPRRRTIVLRGRGSPPASARSQPSGLGPRVAGGHRRGPRARRARRPRARPRWRPRGVAAAVYE